MYEDNLPTVQTNALVEIEKSRAIQEVQAAMVIAKKFPRDMTAAYTRIMKSCERLSLAQSATYAFAKGGQTVTGPSIRLAEVLAQNYGNLDFGIRELERREGSSIAESYCWDIETNVKQTKQFNVAHVRDTKGGGKLLTSERDIYEIIANMGARRLRNCILGIIPGDFVDDAVARCKKVLAAGDKNDPLEARIRRVVLAFKEHGVTQEMIEKRLGHAISLTTGEEIVDLQGIFNALRDKTATRQEFFEFVTDLATTPGRIIDTKTREADEQQRLDVIDRIEKKIAEKHKGGDAILALEEKLQMSLAAIPELKIQQLMAIMELI